MGRRTEVRDDLYSVEGLLRLARTQKNNRASRRMLKFPRFRGHRNICVPGVRDVEETSPIPA